MSTDKITIKNAGMEMLSDFMQVEASANPTLAFGSLILLCRFTKKDDIRRLFGLNEKDYHRIFGEDKGNDARHIKTTLLANQTLLSHLQKESLTVGQHKWCTLLWRLMKADTLADLAEQFNITTEMNLEDKYPKLFDEKAFEITYEELNDAFLDFMVELEEKDSE